MRIDEALKVSDIAAAPTGCCVYRAKETDWYWQAGGAYSLHDLENMITTNHWQPAYVRPQFQIGEKVSFLQACLSGQCFMFESGAWIRKCVNIKTGKMILWDNSGWVESYNSSSPSDIVTIVADPSQEQPEKRQRTHAEIVADIKTLVSELEEVK